MLARIATAADARTCAERDLARADRAFHHAVLVTHECGASLRSIRDASGRAASHERIRRIVAAAKEGGD